ncbi:hypothetical protein VHEMI09669 [[Torrubiella] hemipterigena]|uniref:GST C-terminal domain-containing protein n=1 Tax=[Torrubiella] hemipterigena TaxID=1531966 RepID=A0A0A1TQS0_9HYPO|nr:hypothetical protein VHEMI09669 [[Torrubiella] hemipterigena]
MASELTIYGYDAAAEGITITQCLVNPRKNINKTAYMQIFPLSQGKIPGLRGPGIEITETIAITYASSEGSVAQEAQVLSYVSFANQELLQTLARWFLPLIPGFTDPAPYNFDAIEQGKKASLSLLDNLEAILAKVEWLVGNGPTLADIFIAVVLSRGLQWVLDGKWRASHPACMKHFEKIKQWEPVARVIPHFEMVDVEPPNAKPPTIQS